MLAHLDELVIKQSFPPATRQPVFGRTLSAEQKSAAAELRCGRSPEDYVAQTEVALSTAPVWNGSGSEPRQLVLRVYVASTGDSMAVMPGGLTRVGAASDIPIVTMQRGGGSKDTWVVSEGPVSGRLAAGPDAPQRAARTSATPSCRAAWPTTCSGLGRHIERAEQTVRLLRSLVTCVTREDMSEDAPELVALLHVLADMKLIPARAPRADAAAASSSSRSRSLFKLDANPERAPHALGEVRRIAATVRDRLSLDTWRILNQLQQDFRSRHGRVQFDDVLVHLNRMITDLAAFSGMEMESMTRGHGWLFLDIGRRLERSLAHDAAGAQRARAPARRTSRCSSRCSRWPTAR